MPRKKRPLDRDSGVVRDARLIVIASEDKYAVESYFRRFRTRRVQFVVLPTEDCKSSPVHVMKRLDGYFKDNATEEGDEFWVCIDSDHWVKANHVANLVQVLQQCGQKGYCFAISNPCIELWLLLHFADVEIPVTGRLSMAEAEMQLRSAAGGYKKAKCDRLEITGEQVVRAIERAKTLDVTDEELPRSPFTRVYQIVESLLEKDAIDLSKPGDGH